MTRDWSLEYLGDNAVTIRPQAGAPLEVNARVHDLAGWLRRSQVAGIRDIVPGMGDLVVHLDPTICDVEQVGRALDEALEGASRVSTRADTPVVEVPVVYGGEAGPDLEDVAQACGLDPEEVCRRHAAVEYVVCLVGFLPGFPYLGVLDPALHLPRRRSPRVQVPPGSVAIAGEYTGVYPWASPGGWHLIGRTTLSLFDPTLDRPARFEPGDRVRFVRRRA